MAVVNSPYVGDARGKLGAGVYMRAKGQTLLRSYNPSPLNRRTESQQTQRAQFMAAVKFYSRGVQNLFKFAFQDKPAKESDYNAFMRYNAKIGPYLFRTQFENESYPSIAPWILSRGSLQTVVPVQDSSSLFYLQFSDVATLGADPTVGDVSSFLMSQLPDVEVGDIFTFLGIVAYVFVGAEDDPLEIDIDEAPRWTIAQMTVNPANDRPFSQIGGYVNYQNGTQYIWMGQVFGSLRPSGAACIHSRVRNGQLLVSDSTLVLNPDAQQIYEYSRGEVWRQLIMGQWGAESLSILQGSISAGAEYLAPGAVRCYFDLPITTINLDGKQVYLGGKWPASVFAYGSPAKGLVFRCSDGNNAYLQDHGGTYSLTDGSDTFGSVTVLYLSGDDRMVFTLSNAAMGPTVTDIVFIE